MPKFSVLSAVAARVCFAVCISVSAIAQSTSSGPAPQAGTESITPKPRRIGGGVLPPKVTYQVEPEFSKKERKAGGLTGQVLLNLWVDEKGKPQHIRVIRGMNETYNDKAVHAVEQYKFAPATENGKPVLVELNIEVNFQSAPH